MPTTVELQIPATEVKVGDKIAGTPVENVDSKVKWTIIELANGRKLRLENTEQVYVVRSIPTEQERLAKQHELWQRRCESYLEQYEREMNQAGFVVAKALEALQKDASYRLDSQHGTLASYLTSCANNDIWMLVQRIRENSESHALFEAIELAAQEFERDLMNNSWRHNSTSALSNMIGEYQREAVCQWLRYTATGVRHLVEDGKQFEAAPAGS